MFSLELLKKLRGESSTGSEFVEKLVDTLGIENGVMAAWQYIKRRIPDAMSESEQFCREVDEAITVILSE